MLEDAETRLAVHEAKGPVSFIGKPFTKELVSEYIADCNAVKAKYPK